MKHFYRPVSSLLTAIMAQSVRSWALLPLLFLYTLFCQAQKKDKIDSLTTVLPDLKGEERVTALIDLCYLTAQSDFEASVAYGDQAVDLAIGLEDRSLLANAYKNLGNSYTQSARLATALDLTLRSKDIFTELNDDRSLASVYNNIGNIYRRQSEYTKSLSSYFISLEIKERLGGFDLASSFGNIGHVYRQKGELDKALEYFFKSLEIEKANNNAFGMSVDYTNIGTAYENMGDYEKGIYYARQALEIDIANQDDFGIGINLNNIGEGYLGMNLYDSAQNYFHQSLSIKRSINNRNGIAHTTQRLSDLHATLGEYDSALHYAMESLALAKLTNNNDRRMQNYEVLSEIYEQMDQPAVALAYYKRYKQLKDTIFNMEKEALAADMESKYQSAKKETTIANQQMELAQQQQRQTFYIVVGVLLCVIITGLVFFYLRRQRQNTILNEVNKELDKRNQQNELLLKEIHHRVKNNLEMVKSLISLQSAQLEDGKTRDAMIASQNRVQSMGIIHQKLYQGDNLGSIEMRDYFVNLGEGILDSFNAEEKVKIECVMDDLELDIDTAVPLGLIVNELLTNAIKYAFPQETDGVVQVSLKKEQDTLVLDVSDNGIGKRIGEPAEGTGFGSQLIQLLTAQLQGVMSEVVDQGTRTSFRFKLDTAS